MFWRKKIGHSSRCAKLFKRTPNPKKNLKYFNLSNVHGPLKMLTVTLKWAQILFYLIFWKVANETQVVLCLNNNKKLFFTCSDQKQFCPYLENKNKNSKQILILNFIFVDCFFMVFRFLQEKNKNINFKVPGIFWKWKHCRACAARAAKLTNLRTTGSVHSQSKKILRYTGAFNTERQIWRLQWIATCASAACLVQTIWRAATFRKFYVVKNRHKEVN